ncbi:MAG: PKD domain-containing protein [Planctomycetes bacterium]|nr:PKD domain-containing protein [Planctomycetota bacterium]
MKKIIIVALACLSLVPAWERITVATPPAGTSPAAGQAGAITISVDPSRRDGVAPLSVFFDATGTKAAATTRPFHDIEYRWDFGDPQGSPVSGTTWNAGSRAGVSSRNEATGPVAAHVYERPGTYTVTLTVTDGTNVAPNSSIKIEVQDPDKVFAGANTICVGATTMPVAGQGGCPAGATTIVQPDFAAAIDAHAKTGKRVLFKRGDTFTAAKTVGITVTGPGIVGSFGPMTDPAPKVQMVGKFTMLTLGGSDWRMLDMKLDGGLIDYAPSNNNVRGVAISAGISQVTLLRLQVYGMSTGISSWVPAADQVAIADSSVVHMVGTDVTGGGYGFALRATRLSMLGNLGDDTMTGEHVIRIFYTNRTVISNNTLSRQDAGRAILKMHGPSWGTKGDYRDHTTPPAGYGNGYTEKVVVSDNKFVTAGLWAVTFGPQNIYEDERVRDIIVERNWSLRDYTPTSVAQVSFVVNSSETTLRNNICDVTDAGRGIQVRFFSDGPSALSAVN